LLCFLSCPVWLRVYSFGINLILNQLTTFLPCPWSWRGSVLLEKDMSHISEATSQTEYLIPSVVVMGGVSLQLSNWSCIFPTLPPNPFLFTFHLVTVSFMASDIPLHLLMGFILLFSP
jgi:hypothetical protein